jgi:hypothetical protein
MKQFRRHRPAHTRAQVHQRLNKVVHNHSAHLAFVPPVSHDQLALFEWAAEDDLAGMQDAA